METIKKFLINELKLELNSKSRYYPSEMGVNFVVIGYMMGIDLLEMVVKEK